MIHNGHEVWLAPTKGGAAKGYGEKRVATFITHELAECYVHFSQSPSRSLRFEIRAGNKIGLCRECGCTNERACPGGCAWVEPDLCSSCAF